MTPNRANMETLKRAYRDVLRELTELETLAQGLLDGRVQLDPAALVVVLEVLSSLPRELEPRLNRSAAELRRWGERSRTEVQDERAAAGALLTRLRRATRDYERPWSDQQPAWSELLRRLAAFDASVRQLERLEGRVLERGHDLAPS